MEDIIYLLELFYGSPARTAVDFFFASVTMQSRYLLPPANELFANPEKHEWYMYETCGACRARLHVRSVKNLVGMLWICVNCCPELVKRINQLEDIRKYLNLAAIYGKLAE